MVSCWTGELHRSRNRRFVGDNPLKLGILCDNTLSALTMVPEMFKPTWDNCMRLARLADTVGLKAILPIARWKVH
jgi:hypothetical protein